MRETIEKRDRHLRIAEDARPFAEAQIGGDDDGSALVEPADEVEEKLAARLCKREIAEFVEDDETHACAIYRKITNGFRSEWAAKLYADVRSAIESGRRRRIRAIDAIRMTLQRAPLVQAE